MAVCHESSYRLYIESLLPIDTLFAHKETRPKIINSVDYSSLIRIRHLAGRGITALVRRCLSPNELYVFKGVNFGSFLESPPDCRK